MAHNGSWELGRLEGLIGRFLMSPEGRNVKDSYSLSLEVAAILGLAVIHREFQRHLYPATHLQLQLLRSLGKVTHRFAGNGVDAVAHSPKTAAVSGFHPLLQSSALACDEALRQLFPMTRRATHLDPQSVWVPDVLERLSRAVQRISPPGPENFSAPS